MKYAILALALLITPASAEVLPHPIPCPRTKFCGCGVCLKIGLTIEQCKKRGLMLAHNWLRFPPAPKAPGMVVARRGHVAYIEAIDANGNPILYDPNSGGHKTRRHTRSLSGFKIVNPHG